MGNEQGSEEYYKCKYVSIIPYTTLYKLLFVIINKNGEVKYKCADNVINNVTTIRTRTSECYFPMSVFRSISVNKTSLHYTRTCN